MAWQRDFDIQLELVGFWYYPCYPVPRCAKVWLFLAEDGELCVHQELFPVSPYDKVISDLVLWKAGPFRLYEQCDGQEYCTIIGQDAELEDFHAFLGWGWVPSELPRQLGLGYLRPGLV